MVPGVACCGCGRHGWCPDPGSQGRHHQRIHRLSGVPLEAGGTKVRSTIEPQDKYVAVLASTLPHEAVFVLCSLALSGGAPSDVFAKTLTRSWCYWIPVEHIRMSKYSGRSKLNCQRTIFNITKIVLAGCFGICTACEIRVTPSSWKMKRCVSKGRSAERCLHHACTF